MIIQTFARLRALRIMIGAIEVFYERRTSRAAILDSAVPNGLQWTTKLHTNEVLACGPGDMADGRIGRESDLVGGDGDVCSQRYRLWNFHSDSRGGNIETAAPAVFVAARGILPTEADSTWRFDT